MPDSVRGYLFGGKPGGINGGGTGGGADGSDETDVGGTGLAAGGVNAGGNGIVNGCSTGVVKSGSTCSVTTPLSFVGCWKLLGLAASFSISNEVGSN